MYKRFWNLVLLHLTLECLLKFPPALCDPLEEWPDLEETISETTAFKKHLSHVKSVNKVPWGYSASDLTILYLQETIVHKMMVSYEKVLETRLENVRQYLEDYKEAVPKKAGSLWMKPKTVEETGNIIAGHPVMSYRLIRRFAKQLRWIETSLKYEQDLAKKLKEARGSVVWPGQGDLNRAIQSILNIQHIYDLPTLPFSSGNLFTVDLQVGFSKQQIVEIGETAIHMGQFALGVEWLKAGSSKPQTSLADRPFNETELEVFIKEAVEHHDDEFDAAEVTDLTLFDKKISGLEELPLKRRTLHAGYDPLGLDDHNLHLRYAILCNGVLIGEETGSKLFCWLDNYSHPYFKIQPLRTELQSIEPYVVQFHDLLSADKLRSIWLKALGSEKVVIGGGKAGNKYPLTYLDEERKKFAEFRNVERLAELISGLNVRGRDNSDPLKVSEHTFGARYSLEFPAPKTVKNGEEDTVLANFLFPMMGSVLGGVLVFPLLNLNVDMSPGSAVFWPTNFKNGEPDYRTMHTYCPTLLQATWVAEKRIKSRGNMFKRPCSRIADK